MKRGLAITGILLTGLAGFFVSSLAFGAGETTGTATFTNVVTYTIPTVTQTVTETVTVTAPTTTTQPTTTAPPPPPPNNCTATLATGGSVSAFFNGLSPGAVGCLHGGSYGGLGTAINFTASGNSTAPITLQSYPGETATVQGAFAENGNYAVFKNLKLNVKNNITSSGSCGQRALGFMDWGSNNLFDHVEIYESDLSAMGGALFINGSNTEVRFSKIHDAGSCQSYDHGIYVHSGSGTTIHHNWIWNIPHGWGIQLYPDVSNTHEYGNVIDTAQNGFVVCSTGSNHLIEHNVVSNSGAFTSGCGPQGSSSNNVVSNNDSWNNPGGMGSVAKITYSGNVSVNPQYANAAAHDYRVTEPSLAGYGLWDGS